MAVAQCSRLTAACGCRSSGDCSLLQGENTDTVLNGPTSANTPRPLLKGTVAPKEETTCTSSHCCASWDPVYDSVPCSGVLWQQSPPSPVAAAAAGHFLTVNMLTGCEPPLPWGEATTDADECGYCGIFEKRDFARTYGSPPPTSKFPQ